MRKLRRRGLTCPGHAVSGAAGIGPRWSGSRAHRLHQQRPLHFPPGYLVAQATARTRHQATLTAPPTDGLGCLMPSPTESLPPICPQHHSPFTLSLLHLPALPSKYVPNPTAFHQPHPSHHHLSWHHSQSLDTGGPGSTQPHSVLPQPPEWPRSQKSSHAPARLKPPVFPSFLE